MEISQIRRSVRLASFVVDGQRRLADGHTRHRLSDLEYLPHVELMSLGLSRSGLHQDLQPECQVPRIRRRLFADDFVMQILIGTMKDVIV